MLSMACLAPWAFGAVEAWAELLLDGAIVVLAVLGAVAAWSSGRDIVRFSIPGLSLGLITALAMVQATPLPARVLPWVAPATAALHSAVAPEASEHIVGDSKAPVPLPSLTLSQYPEASVQMAARLAAAWILFHCVLGLETGSGAARRFGLAVVANASLVALFSTVQLLAWNGKIYWLRPSPSGSAGPFVCHSHLAAYLNLGLGLALVSLFSPGRPKARTPNHPFPVFAAYAASMIVVGIVASLSRNGFLGAMVALFLAVLVSRPRRAQVAAGLLALLALVALMLYVAGGDIPYSARLQTLAGTQPYEERSRIWLDAIAAWRDFPVWGTGLGTFSAAAAPYIHHVSGVQFVHAENEYLEWLVEGGMVGAALALIGVLGLAVLARRAAHAAATQGDRAFVLGAVLGGVTILTESAGDFALHIPGVAVTVVILCAYLCKLGLDAAGHDEDVPGTDRNRTVLAFANLMAFPCLSLVILLHGIGLARSEAAYRASGRPPVGTSGLAAAALRENPEDLERIRAALESALAFRPDWAEGHQQLGLTLLKLYELQTADELRQTVVDPAERAVVANHLWLHAQIHNRPPGRPVGDTDLLAAHAVRSFLVPAARAFLEARRSCPVLPIPQAELASLDYLLKDGERSSVMNARAYRLAGPNADVMSVCGQLAAQVGDQQLLAQVLKRRLTTSDQRWERVAEQASLFFSPEQIFSRIVPSGRLAVLFAAYLHPSPADRPGRDHFLRAAIERLPSDETLGPPERAYWEARAWELIGDREQAASRMLAALGLEPNQATWRTELVEWYLRWGRPQEAHEQALIGMHLTPTEQESKRAWEMTVDALARSDQVSPPLSGLAAEQLGRSP
jgi:O-antigen ligase